MCLKRRPPRGGGLPTISGLRIERIQNASANVCCHAVAFYDDLVPKADVAGKSYKLILQSKHDQILCTLLRICNGEQLSDIWHDVTQIHKWNKAYVRINAGNNSHILVTCPTSIRPPEIGDEIVDGDSLKRVTYIEKVFVDLLVAHGQDHSKGRTLYAHIADLVINFATQVSHSVVTLSCKQRCRRPINAPMKRR